MQVVNRKKYNEKSDISVCALLTYLIKKNISKAMSIARIQKEI